MHQFSGRRRAFMATMMAGTLSLALAGCDSKPAFQGTDISGTGLGRGLEMVDGSGAVRTLADYKGRIVVVFFGFTHCPDVCPTAMAQLAQTMALLKDEAKNVQVLMITVDPERDTPEKLDVYAKAFNPSFIGLSGSPAQVQKTAQSFKAFYSKEPGTSRDDYTMNHSSSFYILDQKGEARVLINGNAPAEAIANDIKVLL
jgi:protein SCO1/2